MRSWEDDEADIFGARTQAELDDRMRAAALQPQPRPARREPARSPAVPRSLTPMFNDNGYQFALDGFNMANAAHAMQGGYLQNMANQATGAIRDELQSRVAQAREMRRMQHEKEMKQMELDALIARLSAAR